MKARTLIVARASRGTGAGVTKAFLECGHSVVANSLKIPEPPCQQPERLALVQRDIGEASTAETIVSTAIIRFGSIDVVVNNGRQPLHKAISGLHGTRFPVVLGNQPASMHLHHATGSQADTGAKDRSLPMITTGGVEEPARSVATEHAKKRIRFNAAAPVDGGARWQV